MAESKNVKWSVNVSTRLTNLNSQRKAAIAAKKKATELRDKLMADISECGRNETKKIDALKLDCLDAERKIEQMRDNIHWANSEISETIDRADEPELFGEDTNPKPPRAGSKTKKDQGELALAGGGNEGDRIDD